MTKMMKEQILPLYQIAKQIDQPKTVGELLGMTFVDSFSPKTEPDPDWNFEELKTLCAKNILKVEMSITEAIEKII